MPKQKTIKGAAKRFKVTKKGRVKRKRAFKRHILTHKSGKKIRQLRGSTLIHKADEQNVRMMLPYS